VSKVTLTTKMYWVIVTASVATSRHDEVIEASGTLPGQRRRIERH
jgi:hypothetical protein